jgi:DNA-binding HxlR family transcriptional regulator
MSKGYKNVTKPQYTENSCMGVREVLSLVGGKWSVLIVIILNDGSKRFNELRRNIDGISQRMLTRTLRELERDGLLTRTVKPTVPPSVYYELNDFGKTLVVPIQKLVSWAQKNYPYIIKSQLEFDKRSKM